MKETFFLILFYLSFLHSLAQPFIEHLLCTSHLGKWHEMVSALKGKETGEGDRR